MAEIILFLSVITLIFVLVILYNSKVNRIINRQLEKDIINNNYLKHCNVSSSYIKQKYNEFYRNNDQDRHQQQYQHYQEKVKEEKANEIGKDKYKLTSHIANNTIEKLYHHPYCINKANYNLEDKDNVIQEESKINPNDDNCYKYKNNNCNYRSIQRLD